MKISFIVAMSRNRVIGRNNQLPWRLPADLQHFKKVTLGKPIVMGRKTFDSIGRPLPGRRNIIISRDKNLVVPGCEVFHSVDEALSAVKNETEVMIIGGENLFSQMMHRAHTIYLTLIDADIEGDTFFSPLNSDWKLISEEKHLPDAQNLYTYSFQIWKNKHTEST